MSPILQIWIADSGRRNGVQNLALGVQNYEIVFYLETSFGGLQVTSFQIWIADSAQRKGITIFDLVYKIVQNDYKIMIYFSFSKSVLWIRWHAPLQIGRTFWQAAWTSYGQKTVFQYCFSGGGKFLGPLSPLLLILGQKWNRFSWREFYPF